MIYTSREALIIELRQAAGDYSLFDKHMGRDAADMLEADAQEIKRLEQCRIDEAETNNKAAQASVAVPMTTQQIEKCWEQVQGTSFGYAPFARAIEAHHNIGSKP